MPELRKYATALVAGTAGSDLIRVSLRKAGTGTYATGSDWSPGTGDVKVSIGGASEANIGTLPAYANGAWEFTLSGAELTGKMVRVRVSDAAVDDFDITVETFGHASAMYGANDYTDSVRMGMTALPNAAPAANGGLPTVDASNNVHGLQTAVTLANGSHGGASATLLLRTMEVDNSLGGSAPVTFRGPTGLSPLALWVDGAAATVDGRVALAATQPDYAPAKAGDAMALTGAYDAAKTAASAAALTAAVAAILAAIAAAPAAVWAVLTSTLTAAGSVGYYLLTQLGLVSSGAVNVIGGLANGTLTIRQGDSYGSASGQVLRQAKPSGASWPSDLFSASGPVWVVTLHATKKTDNDATGTATLTKVCTVEDATNVRVDLLASETSALALGTNGWTWELAATRATTPAIQNTLISGNMSVVE